MMGLLFIFAGFAFFVALGSAAIRIEGIVHRRRGPPSRACLNFLRALDREGGSAVDGDKILAFYADEVREAEKKGLVRNCSGWSDYCDLTGRGREALGGEQHPRDRLRHIPLA